MIRLGRVLYLVFEPGRDDHCSRWAHAGLAEICFGHANLDCNGELHFQLSITINCLAADNALHSFVNYCLADFEAIPCAFFLLDVARFTITERQLGQRPIGLQKAKSRSESGSMRANGFFLPICNWRR